MTTVKRFFLQEKMKKWMARYIKDIRRGFKEKGVNKGNRSCYGDKGAQNTLEFRKVVGAEEPSQ
jgi:hypothetical protein